MANPVLKTTPSADRPETGIEGRRRIATALCGVLADTTLLMIKTQGYHWNVVGPLFQPIHEITETQYRDLFAAIDDLAERVRALGELAPGSFTDMIAHARLVEEDGAPDAPAMLSRLIADHETLARRFRDVAGLAAEHGDGATEDMANGRMAVHEKAIWMLRAVAAG